MAIRLADAYVQATAADSNYPGGSFKNTSTGGGADGTPLEKQWANDLWGARDAVLSAAGVGYGGAPDRVGASDFLTALYKLFARIPAGTKMVFVQAAAPTGWTIDTTASYNTAGLRIVTGGGGGATGGSTDAFTAHTHSVPSHGHGHSMYVAGHTLTVAEMPWHTHTITGDAMYEGGSGAITTGNMDYPAAVVDTTDGTGGSQPHAHGLGGGVYDAAGMTTGSFAPKYVNCIVCVKS